MPKGNQPLAEVFGHLPTDFSKVVYTKFSDALNAITRPKVGKIADFMKLLQSKVDEKQELPPTNRTIENPF